MMTVSCREESDDILSYAYDDTLNFQEANSSLEGQFKAIWMAMNCNYPIWDYEEQQGLNWDNVYEKYLPQFIKLDAEYNTQKPVPDSIIIDLYDEIFAPLHDGHLNMYLKNVHTGKKITKIISPQIVRVVQNIVYNDASFVELFYLVGLFKPSLNYYENKNELDELLQEDDYIFARFKDDVVYLRLPQFNLTQSFEARGYDDKNDRIYKLWNNWFNCIQRLQSNNALKGIIIDLRNNKGGKSSDYQYVLGALLYGDIFDGQYRKIGYLRDKSGIGRFDFSQLYPLAMPIYSKQHVAVEVPIIVLANTISASMAEITCLSAKQLKNGYVIGTETYGAYSPSLDNSYAFTYAGNVGDPSLADTEEKLSYFAPFFIDIPTSAFLSLDEQVMDGTGIEPNEIIHLDYSEHQQSGKDNQLDRALEYIRTGK